MTLKSKNILLQKTAQDAGKLVIVDNVGNSDFIPLSNYIGCLARRKILRKWRRFEADIQRQNPNNEVLPRRLPAEKCSSLSGGGAQPCAGGQQHLLGERQAFLRTASAPSARCPASRTSLGASPSSTSFGRSPSRTSRRRSLATCSSRRSLRSITDDINAVFVNVPR